MPELGVPYQEIPLLFPGDHVRILDRPGGNPLPDSSPYGGVFKFERQGPKNGTLSRPGGQGVRADMRTLRKTEEPLPEGPPEEETDLPSIVHCGQIVRLSPAGVSATKGKYTADSLFVVLADKVDKVNIAPLGGDGGRYYRMPRRMVGSVVDPGLVLAQ